MTYLQTVSGDMLPYDARIFGQDWNPKKQMVVDYFTISDKVAEIYTIIHVSDSTKSPVFEMESTRVSDALARDNLIDYSHYY